MTRCTMPPSGWFCTRDAGHEGPCAAYSLSEEGSGWASPTLGRVYDEVDKLRANIAQPPESGIDEALRNLLTAIEVADLEIGSVAS